MLSRCKSLDQVFLDPSFVPEKHLKVHEDSLIQVKEMEKKCIAAKQKKESFDIFYTNMRAKGNFVDVQHDHMAKQSSLICLAQTCLEANEEFEEWDGRISLSYASSGNGKGVACFTDGKMDAEFVNKRQTDNFQLIQLKFMENFQIFIIYISPNSNDIVYEEVSTTLDQMILPGFIPVLLGDFNFHHTLKNPLSNYLKHDLGLKQIISETTFALSKNTIDHVYVWPDFEEYVKVSSKFKYFTDHQAFTISFA